MKALTIRQPWASLIMLGAKHMETRSFDTKYRGPLVIHAGKAMPCRIGQTIEFGPYTVERDRGGLLLRSERLLWPFRLPLGVAIGVVTLFDTRSTDSGEHAPDEVERALGDHSAGRFAWSLSSRSRIKEVPRDGRLGLWDFPDELIKGDKYERQAGA